MHRLKGNKLIYEGILKVKVNMSIHWEKLVDSHCYHISWAVPWASHAGLCMRQHKCQLGHAEMLSQTCPI